MSIPDWRKSTAGSRVRVALWLASEVGVGGTFTKAQLREAFPSVEQIDRRMRDLRPEGWVIATYTEDRSLATDELKLVSVGGRVWEPRYKSRSTHVTVTDKQRKAILAAANYACAFCGIGGGERYPDDSLRTAKLAVARRAEANAQPPQLQALCDRCLAAEDEGTTEADVLEAIASLDSRDRELLRSWVRRGERRVGPADGVWASFRRLPHASRLRIAQKLE